MFFLISAVLFILGILIPHGKFEVMLFTLSVLLLNVGLFRIILKVDKRYFAYKLYLVGSMVIPYYFVLNNVFFGDEIGRLLSTTDLYSATPWSLYAFSIAPVIGVLFALAFSGSRARGLHFVDYFRQADPAFDFVSLLLIVPVLGTWITQVIGDTPITYYLNVLNKTFMFFPVIAGYRVKYNPLVGLIWAGVLVVGLGLGFLTGNRGQGFFPAWFFVIGFALSLPVRKRFICFASMLVFMLFAMYASGVSSAIRETLGRRSLRDMDFAEIVQAWPVIMDYVSGGDGVAGAKETNAFHKGLKRMVPWTRVVVPNATGDGGVPFRRTDELKPDILAFFSWTKLNRYTGIQVYPTVIHAAPYGFRVSLGDNARGTTSTVPFGWEVDGWSRGGPLVTALYACIIFGWMAVFERVNQRINRRNTNVRLLCLCAVWGLPFSYFATYGLVHSLRQYTIQFILVFVLAHVLNQVGKVLKNIFPALISRRRLAQAKTPLHH